MNVGLPGGGDPASGASASFWVILGLMVALFAGMFAYFRKRHWLYKRSPPACRAGGRLGLRMVRPWPISASGRRGALPT